MECATFSENVTDDDEVLLPSTLNPKPQTLNPEPHTPNPEPQTPNLKPQSLNPEPSARPPEAWGSGFRPIRINIHSQEH